MPGTDDPANLTPAPQMNAESSDSEDQFTDAQSAPRSPLPLSPKPSPPVEPASNETPSATATTKVDTSTGDSDAEPENGSVTPGQEHISDPEKAVDERPAIVVEEASTPTPQPKADATNVPDTQPGAFPDSPSSSKSSLKNAGAIENEEGVENKEEDEENEEEEEEEEDDDNDAFGDDFDDFEEGGGEEDFDDFEDGFQQPGSSQAQESMPPPQQTSLPFPIPDFDDESADDMMSVMEPYLATLFPPESLDLPQFPPLSKSTSSFTTPRSASLWSQLVAPPPLAPPDWIRSRTRRLFLVSLGVPVDLDEILPASKQKKLVLPSLNVPSSGSPRTSSDSRSVSRLRQGDANSSSASVDTQGKPRKRKGPPPQPELDIVAATYLCQTTDEALDGMTDEELKSHVAKLEGLQGTAKEVLEYWQKRTDEKIAERETFEGVIENLVKHARKVRK